MASTTAKAIGIVLIALVVGAASCIMVLLVLLGLFYSRSETDGQFAAIVISAYLAILVGGILAMLKLRRSIRLSHQPASAPAVPALLDEAAAARATADLRIVVQSVLALSVFMLMLRFAVRAITPDIWKASVLYLLLYQWPYALVWWRERDRPDRLGALIAICFAAASIVSSLFSVLTTLATAMRVSGFQLQWHMWMGWGLFLVADAAVVWFAWRLCRILPRAREEELYIISAIIGSIAYLGMLRFSGMLLFQYLR